MKIALAPIILGPYRLKPGTPGYEQSIQTLLWRVKQIGYDGIEFGTPEGFTPEQLKEYVDGIGLEIITAGGLRYPALEGADFSAKVKECQILGAKNVMVSNMDSRVLGNADELKLFIGHLNRAGKQLMEEGGVHLSYHNHAVDFSKIGGETILKQIVENTDPRYVFFEPDTHWLQAGGAHVLSWLRALKGRMYIVHFKDYAIDPYSDHAFLEGTHKLFAEIGKGNLNWRGIVDECHAQGIQWCAVEQDRSQKPPYESIKISLDYLKVIGA